MSDPPPSTSTTSPSKHLLTSLLTSLSTINPPAAIPALNTLPPPQHQHAKSILLTLHFLFPHELLPALDILDRRLISHLHTGTNEVYYVRSATASTGTRFRNALSANAAYEVRLESWNCSCAAFALSALRVGMRVRSTGDVSTPCVWEGDWVVGGTVTRDEAGVPVCKHILAVVLGRAAPGLFGNGVVSREVEREEMAGWAAGWGEH